MVSYPRQLVTVKPLYFRAPPQLRRLPRLVWLSGGPWLIRYQTHQHSPSLRDTPDAVLGLPTPDVSTSWRRTPYVLLAGRWSSVMISKFVSRLSLQMLDLRRKLPRRAKSPCLSLYGVWANLAPFHRGRRVMTVSWIFLKMVVMLVHEPYKANLIAG